MLGKAGSVDYTQNIKTMKSELQIWFTTQISSENRKIFHREREFFFNNGGDLEE
jgi:hypothetical protein